MKEEAVGGGLPRFFMEKGCTVNLEGEHCPGFLR